MNRKYKLRGVSKTSEDLSPMVGRIPVISLSPRQKELYFLRMLLNHVKGPRGYGDLRTVDGVVFDTFQEACVKLGLVRDTKELDNVLNDAATCRFGNDLRELFAFLLIYCNPVNPYSLFEKHKRDLCEDLLRKSATDVMSEIIVDKCLNLINRTLLDNGMDLTTDFGFPEFARSAEGKIPAFLIDEMNYDIQALSVVHQENLNMMTNEQKSVGLFNFFDKFSTYLILDSIRE